VSVVSSLWTVNNKACEASYFTHDGIVGINERIMEVEGNMRPCLPVFSSLHAGLLLLLKGDSCSFSLLLLTIFCVCAYFAAKVVKPFALQNPGFLGVVGCYNLTLQKGCDYSSDGRHYPRLAAAELRLHLQQTDSRFPKTTG
jgi:hypothetical protein